jgi:hypothetical protein
MASCGRTENLRFLVGVHKYVTVTTVVNGLHGQWYRGWFGREAANGCIRPDTV